MFVEEKPNRAYVFLLHVTINSLSMSMKARCGICLFQFLFIAYLFSFIFVVQMEIGYTTSKQFSDTPALTGSPVDTHVLFIFNKPNLCIPYFHNLQCLRKREFALFKLVFMR